MAQWRAHARRALDAGISIAVGTDGGPGGVSTHLELEFLAGIDLTPAEILRAATLGGARALGREAEIGTIEAGKLADLVILNANPLDDVKHCRDIARVLKAGTDVDAASRHSVHLEHRQGGSKCPPAWRRFRGSDRGVL